MRSKPSGDSDDLLHGPDRGSAGGESSPNRRRNRALRASDKRDTGGPKQMPEVSRTSHPRRPSRRGIGAVAAGETLSPDARRRVIVEFLKSIESQLNPDRRRPSNASGSAPKSPGPLSSDARDRAEQSAMELTVNLSPRLRQTLARLLAGDSEKQAAYHLGLSKNTVHVYVKALYRQYNVNSRGELLARFVQASDRNAATL